MKSPQALFNGNSQSSAPKHHPQPLVPELLSGWPERVLLIAELLQVLKLLGVGYGVAPGLMLLGLLVSTKVSQKHVVGGRSEEFDWCEHVGAIQEYDKGEMDECITEITVRG